MTQSEIDFIEEYARVLLVQWCLQTLTASKITDISFNGCGHVSSEVSAACFQIAQDKGWVNKTEPNRVLAKGFATAASFLKR